MGYFADEPKILPEYYLNGCSREISGFNGFHCVRIIGFVKISLDNVLNLRGWLLPLTSILTMLLLSRHFVWTCRLGENPNWKVSTGTPGGLGRPVGAGQSMD